MKLCAIALLLLSITLSIQAADNNSIPPEILSGRTCEEHIVQAPQMTSADLPKVRGEYSAMVVVSFKLDGSGKAMDPKVVYSKPSNLFAKTALDLLDRTQFAAGATEDLCYYLRSYSKVRRGTSMKP